MSNKIILSMIIPVFNMKEYIVDCLESIFSQKTKFNYEVIVVNDGSFDNSRQLIEEFIKKHKVTNCRLYNKDNGGLSSARNFGLDKMKGEYFSFIDSDDWVSSDYIDSICDKVNSSNALMFYFDRYFSYPSFDQKVTYPVIDESVINRPSIINEINLSACNKVFNSEMLGSIKFPVGMLYEDFPYILEVLCICGRVDKIDSALYYVRQNTPNSITNKLNIRECDMLKNMLYVEGYISRNFKMLLGDFYIFRDRTVLYWYVKLLRHDAYSMIDTSDFVRINNSSHFSFKERFIIGLINLNFTGVARNFIIISDFIKRWLR